MLILKIPQIGLVVTIPGVRPLRTPTEIDITNLDMNVVLSHLKMCGIDDYDIIEKTESGILYSYNKKKKVMVDERLEEIFVNEEVEVEKEMNLSKKFKSLFQDNDVSTRLDNIENMLKDLLIDKQNTNKDTNELLQLVEKFMSNKQKTTSRTRKKEKIEDETVDAFIPDVDIDNMKIKSDIQSIKQDSNDKQESADLLSNLSKKNNGELKHVRRKTK